MPNQPAKPIFMNKDNATFDEWYAELRRFATERHDDLALAAPPDFWRDDYDHGRSPKGAWAYAWGD